MVELLREAGDSAAALTLQRHASLHDWRRQVAALYADIRANPGLPGWQRWRNGRDRLFRTHPQSPLAAARRAQFSGIDCFPYEPSLRFEVDLAPARDRDTIRLEAGKDGTVSLLPFALTDGLRVALGRELTLYWIEGYAGGAFLPFGDASNGRQSYAGGRYLLDTIKSADLGSTPDGRLILDFNFAYYPSCAYSEAWVCPLSPIENRLPVAIPAGERNGLSVDPAEGGRERAAMT